MNYELLNMGSALNNFILFLLYWTNNLTEQSNRFFFFFYKLHLNKKIIIKELKTKREVEFKTQNESQEMYSKIQLYKKSLVREAKRKKWQNKWSQFHQSDEEQLLRN